MASLADFRARYPALAGTADQTIGYWLMDSARIVTADWGADADPARLAYVAHNIAVNAPASGPLPAGVTSFRSGSFSVSVSDAAAARSAAGGYGATPYGQEFAIMLGRNRGGMRLL